MFIIVGFGPAAMGAIEALRRRGDDTKIVVFGSEAHPAYFRPYVGKELLSAGIDLGALALRPEEFFRDNGVDIELGRRVARADPSFDRIVLENGKEFRYESLLIATGARPRTLDVPGANLDGIMTLRTYADGTRLRERLDHASSVVVVGGGLLGLDVAVTARTMGLPVTVVESSAHLLDRVASPLASEPIADLLKGYGVRLRRRARVVRYVGQKNIEAVELQAERLECARVVVAAGIRRNDGLVLNTGILADNGILVSRDMRTTAPNVFAAGDVAAVFDEETETVARYESFAAAYQQGSVAGANMLGGNQTYRDLAMFGVNYFGHSVRGMGELKTFDECVIQDSVDGHAMTSFAIANDHIVGIFAINGDEQLSRYMTLLRGGARAEVIDDIR